MSHSRHQYPSSRSAGFTLVELLVVIGIIVLLISILLPVAGRVRLQAQSAKTQSTMSAISGAIERYFLEHKTYPGVIPNTMITTGFPVPGGNLTSSENLVLSLAGGFTYGTPTTPTVVMKDIGKGPLNLSASAVRRTRSAPYIEAAAGGLLPPEPWNRPISGPVAGNPLEMPGRPAGTADTHVPEFLDDYSQRRVVLYLRANVGGATFNASPTSGTAGYEDDTQQYNRTHLQRYERTPNTGDKTFIGDFNFSTTDNERYQNWGMYLSHPNVANAPRGKDKYILISAGADRTYGTRDDIFAGG